MKIGVLRLAGDRIERDARAVDDRRQVQPRRLRRVVAGRIEIRDLIVDLHVRRVPEEARAVIEREPRAARATCPARRTRTSTRGCASSGTGRFRCTAEKTPSSAFEYAKPVSSGLLVLRVNWYSPIQLPPRASLFCMYSR